MKTKLLMLMSALTFFGCHNNPTPSYPSDLLTLRDDTQATIRFFAHASLSIEFGGKYIYIDPVGDFADYAALPKADLVLVTHSHSDHFDPAAIATLSTPQTTVICDRTSADSLKTACTVMTPGDTIQPRDYVSVQAVAAYNTSEGHLQFHPRERGDCGYVLTLGGSRIYIAGDTEPTPEMAALTAIDIALLPVNQPYTMTVDEATDAVRTLHPAIFYPYHYGQVDEKTDLDRLVQELAGTTDIRIRPME